MHRQLYQIICYIFIFCLITSVAFAKKPERNRLLEKYDARVESTVRFENMRVRKDNGVPVAVYRLNYPVTPGTPETMARQYLRENAALLRLQSDLSDLQHTRTIETPGGYHVRFRQVSDGFPVYDSEVVVTINRKNAVNFVMNNYQPQVSLVDNTISVSKTAAFEIAKNYLNFRGEIAHQSRETVVYHANGKTHLVQRIVMVPSEDLFGDWEILVDAQTGEILRVEDKALYAGPKGKTTATGSGWVFDPDPLTHARASYQTGGQFGDNNDADSDSLTAHTVQRDLLDIEFDGTNYHLRGPYAQIVDSEAPFNGVYSQTTNTWHFTRNADAFEAANVYYHLDASMRYINETLGFSLMPYQYSGGVKGDPHGLNGQDNSHYITSTGQLAWGEGGVDDAEDADVILHELGHGLHDWLTNGGLSQVDGLSEGSGDYWANSYNRSKGFWTDSDPQYWWVFQWDGHNEYWNGRITNYTAQYPGGLTGSIHTDGQIWASTLMQIWDDIGREATDANFLEALAMTNSSASQEDAAQAFIQADINLHGGANLNSITTHFTDRGYNITVPTPQITHTPLNDTEDVNGPYLVSAQVSAANNPVSVKLVYGTNGAFTDTLAMQETSEGYTVSIPGTGVPTTYQYYILAIDALDLASTEPPNAPQNFHSFTTGPDNQPPAITHTPLGNQALLRWPATVVANITDNIGIQSATVEYLVNGSNGGSFALTDNGNNEFSGPFDIPAGDLNFGDQIEYRIVAVDASSQSNQTIDPATGYHSFEITDVLGAILIIDDDPNTGKTEFYTDKGHHIRDIAKNPFGATATIMESYLSAMGYLAVVETPTTTDPATWGNYDLIISSSGLNTDPVEDAAYRAALENWVSTPTNKLLIEGGEVGYDAASSPGYPSFAANVLHTADWDADNAGPLNQLPAQSDHPIAKLPNLLPATLDITYSGWGSEDAVDAVDGAYLVYETNNNPANAGISVYDDNADPRSAQIVYFAFNFAELTDQTVAQALLENTVTYLLTKEVNTQTASLNLLESWNLISLPVTPDDSHYQTLFPNALQAPFLFNGSYQVAEQLQPGNGYWLNNTTGESVNISGVAVENLTLSLQKGWNLIGGGFCDVSVSSIEDPDSIIIQPIFEFDGAYQTATTISAGKGYWVNAAEAGSITINCGTLAKAAATPAEWESAPRLVLRDARGDRQTLYFNATVLAEKEIGGISKPPLPPKGVFDARFTGDFLVTVEAEPVVDIYATRYPITLQIDNLPAAENTGWIVQEVLNNQVVREHSITGNTTITIEDQNIKQLKIAKSTSTLPQQFDLAQNYPNPFNPTTTITYALPKDVSVRLEIFNLLGQRIKVLTEGYQTAGFKTVVWDGNDQSGKAVSSGIYIYRLKAGDFTKTRKMMLMK
jgi:predicted small secreted protein